MYGERVLCCEGERVKSILSGGGLRGEGVCPPTRHAGGLDFSINEFVVI